MNKDDLRILLETKNYPDSLINWAIKLYPIMCDCFGEKNTITFFEEYKLVPQERIKHSSGATYKDKKIITFDWQVKNLHEALTIFIHEASHAISGLETSNNKMLMEGHETRESFFAKLEEALVSDKQNELEYGELNYKYETINTFDDDEFHTNNFKTQPTHKYTINNVYYRALQLLLGNNKDLLKKNMFAETLEEKNYYYNQGILFLKKELTEDELASLTDCACVFTLNYSYHGTPESVMDYLKKSNEEDKKKCINILKEYFPQNLLYASKRDLLEKSIFASVDDLCSLTLNVLKRRLESNDYDKFSAIKEACTYLVKIDNNSEKLTTKTNELKELLYSNINKLFPQLTNIDMKNYNMKEEDKFTLITQLISLSSFKEENSNNIFFNYNNNQLHISFNNQKDYIVKKENIYPDEEISFVEPKPIGYNILIEENKDIIKEDKKNTTRKLK